MRYVDASDLDDETIDFDGLNVESPSGEKLGDVDGFIIDVNSARPFYVVVDAGGWFRSKQFLLPVGHARLDAIRKVFVADLTRDRIEKFPGFDKDEFARLSGEELDRFGATMTAVCESDTAATMGRPWHEHANYGQPDWWQTGYYRPERMVASDSPSSARRLDVQDRPDRGVAEPSQEDVVARESDTSPHFEGRAQPGDVLGVETGGEETHVGDTRADEDARRRDAEKQSRR
jgi:hypothetical protein